MKGIDTGGKSGESLVWQNTGIPFPSNPSSQSPLPIYYGWAGGAPLKEAE